MNRWSVARSKSTACVANLTEARRFFRRLADSCVERKSFGARVAVAEKKSVNFYKRRDYPLQGRSVSSLKEVFGFKAVGSRTFWKVGVKRIRIASWFGRRSEIDSRGDVSLAGARFVFNPDSF